MRVRKGPEQGEGNGVVEEEYTRNNACRWIKLACVLKLSILLSQMEASVEMVVVGGVYIVASGVARNREGC